MMLDEFRFYVYAYLDPRKPGEFRYGDFVFDHEPFYVGKGGSRRRSRDHLFAAFRGKHSHLCHRILKLKSLGFDPIIVFAASGLLAVSALRLERFLIFSIGRIDLGTGSLVNLSGGGDGAYEVSEETKKKLRDRVLPPLRPEVKAKISAKMLGRIFTDEHRRHMSESFRGISKGPLSKETKLKISLALKGRLFSASHKAKISAGLSGKAKSPQHAAFCRIARLGKPHTIATRRHLSLRLRGRIMTEQHRARISFSRRCHIKRISFINLLKEVA